MCQAAVPNCQGGCTKACRNALAKQGLITAWKQSIVWSLAVVSTMLVLCGSWTAGFDGTRITAFNEVDCTRPANGWPAGGFNVTFTANLQGAAGKSTLVLRGQVTVQCFQQHCVHQEADCSSPYDLELVPAN